MATVLSALLSVMSCDVHEFPDAPKPKRQLTVELVFDHDLPLFQLVEYDKSGSRVRSRSADCERRYILKAYRISRGEASRGEEISWTLPVMRLIREMPCLISICPKAIIP